jgi:Lrp/AsnC family transcriptional regulator for asnA, asnC and gidA
MIDDIDRKLILELQKGRHSRYANLSKKLQVSQSTISRRINRLLKEKIIRIVALPNIRALGYKASAFINLNVDISKIDDICEKLTVHPDVYTVSVVFGRWDIIIVVLFYSLDSLTEFIKTDLSQIEGIRRIETLYVAEIRKLTFGWIVPSTSQKVTSNKKLKEVLKSSSTIVKPGN